MIGKSNATARVGFYLVPQFSMIAFSSAIEPLRMANQLTGMEHYHWGLISSDGEPVSCSNGISIAADYAAGTREQFDAVFVCSGINIHKLDDEPGLLWLKQLEKSGTILGAVCTGTA